MLNIFNTLTHKKEKFKPNIKNNINIYVCGVTVYDLCHLGHARTFIVFDVVYRYFIHIGYNVNYVRNITDIDDKIIDKSIINKENIHSFTENMINYMHKDFNDLKIIKPSYEPKATNNINEIINMISCLLDNNYAYISNNGDVMFSIDSYIDYGKLSRQKIKKLKIGSSIKLNIFKKNPLDFVLWKCLKNNKISSFIKEGTSWISPWGKGRPGWHIECSAIINKYFGSNLDIHGGGSDLIFPHHENEISQSTCFNNCKYVNYWMHVGMIITKNRKMSKSYGNFLTIRELLKSYDDETIRLFIISSHYRHPIYYNKEKLFHSRLSLERLYIAMRGTKADKIIVSSSYMKLSKETIGIEFEHSFYEAMNDDFNTPKALRVLFSLAHKINRSKLLNNNFETQKLAFKLKLLSNILGLLLQSSIDFFNNKKTKNNQSISEIENLILLRKHARINSSWHYADYIRHKLSLLGVILEDTPEGTLWKWK
ncbi:cysteine--tRNA ligase [Buchnera aphidicola (Neophyllaphis podocarpi)]|uniref:cysteine--tRNA ligase n=1 Tax=Buchnera aphidicola TaxID=9 RepID=UPI0031B830A2